jgi:DNA-directed RNA polymerase sigma subunit (sigma70/sigma32)
VASKKSIKRLKRNRRIVVLRDRGLTLRAIGYYHGLTHERIRQIYNETKHKPVGPTEKPVNMELIEQIINRIKERQAK